MICSFLATITSSQQLTEQDRAYHEIKDRISVKQSLRLSKEKERADLRRQIATLRQEREQLLVLHAELIETIKASEAKIASNAERTETYSTLRDRKTTQLVWNAVTSQQLKARSPIAMLVIQSNPLKVDRLYHYHRYFVKHLDTQINQLQTSLQELTILQSKAELTLAEYSRSKREFEATREALQERSARLEVLNRQLQLEINALDTDLAQLIHEREQLSQLIASRVSSSPRTVNPPTHGMRSDLANWPTVGSVRQEFGALRADGRIRSEGMVINAVQGAPISAVASGVVLFAQWFEGYGNTLIIDHGDEVISIYAHCDRLLKQASEPVEAGEIVATVGNGGADRSAGLYFEIRIRNKPTDPRQWLDEPR